MLAWATGFDTAPLAMLLAMFGVLVLGMFMDELSMMLITVPIFFPLAGTYGFYPIWFGVIVLLAPEISFTTPPVGLLLFVMKGVAPPGTSLADIHRAALPFMDCALLLVGLLTLERRLAPLLPALAATDQPADFCPWTAKKDAILGCSGSSTKPSIRRAWRILCPRTISPSFGFAIGLRASGTASAAV
jgi:hypothetical protein